MSTSSVQEERWQLALQHAGFGIWDLDPVAERVHYSPQWKRRLHLPDCEAADSTDAWRRRVHPDDLGPMLAALRAHLDGHCDTYEMRFRLRDGAGVERRVLSRGRVVARDAQGRALRMVGTMIEWAEPARVARVGALQPSVGELSQLSHDLRTPLHAILGFSQLLEGPHGAGLSDEQRRHIALIQSAGWQLLGVVEDLLDQASHGAGAGPALRR